MSIYLGGTKIGQMYLGSTAIAEAYLGGTKVFGANVAPSSRLPSGYTEVEYIANTNNSLIRIGFYMNPRYSIHVKFGQDAVNRAFVCATNTSYSPYFYSYYDSSHDVFNLNVGRNGSSLVTKAIYSPLDTAVHEVDYVCDTLSTQKYYHNGVQVATSGYDMSSANNDTLPYALFARNKGSSSSDYFYKGRIYEFWVKDVDGTMLVELVPCVRDSDSKPGFYDIVRDAFYSGGANIVAGPEV